ncbi:MAG TPA: hypothetical protein PJ986_04095 [Gammaproteobacteria bacterium]|nr:hypothetical protein [Gammaproteobacteria bacterium]
MTRLLTIAQQLSEAVVAASRLVTEHFDVIEAIPQERRLDDDPAAIAVELLAVAINEADRTLADLRDRFDSPAWLAAEEGVAQ